MQATRRPVNPRCRAIREGGSPYEELCSHRDHAGPREMRADAHRRRTRRGWKNRLQMRVTQPAWRQEVLSDATRVRIANNCASIGHVVLPSIANLRSARSRRPDALYLHVAGKENVCIECSDIQMQGFLRGQSFGRLRHARNAKTLLRNRASEHNRAAEVHAQFGRLLERCALGINVGASNRCSKECAS